MVRLRIFDITDQQLVKLLAQKWLRGEAVAIPKHLVTDVRAAIELLKRSGLRQ
jgi:hypothetical protein